MRFMLFYRHKAAVKGFFFAGAISGLYFTSLYSYVLFHTFTELFSITIAWCFFIIVWNTRQYIFTDFFMIIAVSSLFTGSIDLLHTLAYKGMNVFAGYNSNLATQLWIASRYMLSLSLLFSTVSLYRPILIFVSNRKTLLLSAYSITTVTVLVLIFSGNFPVCYIEGKGLTLFKIISEYIIIIIFSVSGILFYFKKNVFERGVYLLLLAAISSMAASDLLFTLYVGVYDFFNFSGHIMKLVTYYLLYLSIVKTGLEKPFKLLFRDLKKSEEDYIQINTYLNNLIRYANVPIMVWDNELKITEYNMAMEKLIGLKKADVIGKNLKILFIGDNPDYYNMIADSTSKGLNLESVEIPVRSGDGIVRTGLWNTAVIRKDDNTIAAVIAQGMDITERRKAELEIRKHLAEKEIILKEVHHRIKNNMNTIANLLMLQIKSTSNSETVTALENARSRIQSMMTLYDTLFISGNYMQVSTKQYLESLIADIAKNYRTSEAIKISTDICELVLPPKVLFPIGMIINELIMNSLKYAFPETSAGEISVIITKENNILTVVVKDDGIGILESTTLGKSDGFGLNLVLLLAEQIRGKIERMKIGGTAFRITVEL